MLIVHWASDASLGDLGVGRDVDLEAGIGGGPGVGAGVEDGGHDQQVPVKAEKRMTGMVMYCFACFCLCFFLLEFLEAGNAEVKYTQSIAMIL